MQSFDSHTVNQYSSINEYDHLILIGVLRSDRGRGGAQDPLGARGPHRDGVGAQGRRGVGGRDGGAGRLATGGVARGVQHDSPLARVLDRCLQGTPISEVPLSPRLFPLPSEAGTTLKVGP